MIRCRPPRGGRGLKSYAMAIGGSTWQSPPSRGAWIEIERQKPCESHAESPPSRGAWIEMKIHFQPLMEPVLSPPSRGAWIEIRSWTNTTATRQSPPSRGAWIEIHNAHYKAS